MQLEKAHAAPSHAHALFERATGAAIAGRYAEAKRLLVQVWAAGDPELAGIAAWALGWVLVQQHEFAQAAAWFARANVEAGLFAQTWPFVQTTLVEHFKAMVQPNAASISSNEPLPALRITTLGEFQVVRGGETLPACKARKAIAVLRYLLTQPRFTAHKDQITEQFWPQSGAHEAGHSLHVAIAALRRYLDPPHASYILFSAGCYVIESRTDVSCDAVQFQRHAEAADLLWHAGETERAAVTLAGAVALYSGDYTVDDRDGAWSLVERERLLIQYLTALDRLGRIHLGNGRHADAAECFRMLLERDGYREDACATLMRCYYALNRRHDALRAFEQCRALLRADLGLDPGEQLIRVWREVCA